MSTEGGSVVPTTGELKTAPDGSILGLHEIRKSFGELVVLDGVELTIKRGEVVCILGPSGSGKSTLLRCVNLLSPPDSGRIVLEGEEITGKGTAGLDRDRQRVGMLFQ